MKTDIPTNGFMVKNHISSKTGFGYLAIRKTSFLSWFHAWQVLPLHLHQLYGHLWNRRVVLLHLFSSSLSSSTVGEMSVRERGKMHLTVTSLQCQCLSWLMIGHGNLRKPKTTTSQKPNKKETTIERGSPCDDSEIPEWLQEFRENLVDDEIPLQGGSHASSSHEASLEPTTKRREDLGKHSVKTYFPKDRIERSVNGPKLQGLHAEDAMAKPYLEL